MADTNREAELARAAEELHGATTEIREMLEYLRHRERGVSLEDPASIGSPRGRLRVEPDVFAYSGASVPQQPPPELPLLSGGDPTLAERFEDELHGSSSSR